MSFLAPAFLLLLLLVPVIWFWPLRLRDLRLGLLRSAVLVLLIFAVARPITFRTDEATWHVIVVDQSASVAQTDDTHVSGLVARIPGDDHKVLIRVGEVPDSLGEACERVISFPGASPLGAALSAAARSIPVDARGSVTVFTDGLATRRDWGEAAADLSGRGIPVFSVRTPERERSAALVGLQAVSPLRVGALGHVRAHLVGEDASVRVRLNGPDGELAVSEVVTLDGRASADLWFEPKAGAYLAVEAQLEIVQGEDTRSDDDRWSTTFAVQDPLRVLYLGARMREGGKRLGELVGAGLDLIEPASGKAPTSDELRNADLVVLDDRPADTIPEALQQQIVDAVKEGRVGLLMSGGRAAFGGGGYARSPIAATLPVELVQKEEKRDPSTALVVIIDTSGSMGGNRVQLAKEVARLAMRRLLPHDKVGIVEFYGAKRWAAPIQPASNAIEIQRALNRLNAGGGTVIMPAIEEAFYGLQNVRTRYKHVLVLTDGGVEQGAFEPLVRRMAGKGINVSTVLVGPGSHSEFLVNIANWGKGRFYSVPNRFNLPEVLLKQPAGSHLPSWRPGSHPLRTRGSAGWWRDIDRESVPPVAGYVEAQARPGADILLEVRATQHPVLSTWRYGAGRVTALLTEPTGPGTTPWRDWEDYGTWLGRLLARTASDTRAPYAYSLDRRGDEMFFVARRLRAGALVPTAMREGSEAGALTLRERAPGRYEARFPVSPEVEVRLLAGVPGRMTRTRLVSPAREDAAPEGQEDPTRALNLRLLAEASGGRIVEKPGSFLPEAAGALQPVGVRVLWPWLALLALVLYLIELIYRRSVRLGGVS